MTGQITVERRSTWPETMSDCDDESWDSLWASGELERDSSVEHTEITCELCGVLYALGALSVHERTEAHLKVSGGRASRDDEGQEGESGEGALTSTLDLLPVECQLLIFR